MSKQKDGYLTIDDILVKAKNSTKTFIANLEDEESNERIETVDSIQNRMLADKKNTDRKKHKFISEIKSGLGKEILTTNGVKIKKRTLGYRLKKFFIKLYSRF